ncbi:DUF6361 family protein [Kinneretia aquatilis]|uniref:DUF6361 family protein n=1 Tax=Kinneretia aquatilis TaxID=2070761 RepID=UPI001495317C|nr:DUF6361 family protein [Paucibacter aquatile]WIV99682.1 DUF6361 family protein [Paucibacter aquatile]
MPALQWLDFSPTEREDVLTLLESQKDKSTIDELGLGLVRDAISDHLFPGLSTIQTRARYFLFVAWLLRDLERGNVQDDRLVLTLRQREVALINALLATDGGATEERHPGLIGRESRETTKRLPSAIYWGGMRRYGIYQGAGSLQEYLSDLPDLRRHRRRRSASADNEEASDGDLGATTWDPGLPTAEADFLTETSFDLTRGEARYLNEKVLGLRTSSGQVCLLQWMVRYLDAATVAALEAPWALLDETGRWPVLPTSLRAELTHAHHFSLCTRVLTAVYTRLLAARRRDLDLAHYDDLLADALSGLGGHAPALQAWYADLPAFWRWISQVNPRLQRDRPFIEEWLRLLAEQGFSGANPAALLSIQVERWMQGRERRLKGALARMGNPPVLQRWSAPEWLGLTDYRWRTARDIVIDILTGLGRTGEAAHAAS